MKVKLLAMSLLCLFTFGTIGATEASAPDSTKTEKSNLGLKKSNLLIGGYGEIVMTRNFFSDNYLRYSKPEAYANDRGHGRFDIPHMVIFLGYDFGKGWTFQTEIEFEHGGIGAATEIEEEEGGEYETEVERGGEVVLEQLWIQKAMLDGRLNIRLGHIIVPIGQTNQHHMPNEYFGVYRPEGNNTILPCTWHETGVSLWGKTKQWRYEALFITGLDSDRFNRKNWIKGSAGSPYEFKIANTYATALRIDNYSVPGLQLGLSGYTGNSFRNTLSVNKNEKYKDVKGTVLLGAFDFNYSAYNFIIRGGVIYGHLTDSKLISQYNMSMPNASVSSKQAVASDAISIGVEAGYDFFALNPKLKADNQKFYLFGRYDYYDSMFRTAPGITNYEWCGRNRVAVGVNYYPVKQVIIKAEYANGIMPTGFNNEPSVSIGVCFAGFFL